MLILIKKLKKIILIISQQKNNIFRTTTSNLIINLAHSRSLTNFLLWLTPLFFLVFVDLLGFFKGQYLDGDEVLPSKN
jgi:hypothetical protein